MPNSTSALKYVMRHFLLVIIVSTVLTNCYHLQAMENADLDGGGLNVLDKERNLLNDDPKWQGTSNVILNHGN